MVLHPSLVVPPWYSVDNDPDLVQAVAESQIIRRDRDLPDIIGIVRRAVVPSVLGYPAYTANNFFDDLADEMGPDGFLDGLDRAVSSGAVPAPDPDRLTWDLPARGSRHPKCGRFVRSCTFGCPEGHEVHGVQHNCGRLSCPVCYPLAVARMANRSADVLDRVVQLNGGIFTMRHVVVSPPQEWAEDLAVSKSGFRYLKTEVWRVLRGCGASGCVMMFHPYRQNDGSDEWRPGPHFHTVMLSPSGFVDPRAVPPGWVVKVVGGPVHSDRLFPLLYYVSSHAGVSEGVRKAVSYYGCCSTAGRLSPVKVGEWSEDVQIECRTCRGPEYRYLDFMAVRVLRWADTAPPVSEGRTWRAWCLRKIGKSTRLNSSHQV